jgi:hypothetical protein
MNSANEAFEPNLKKDPRLVYRKVRARMFYEASALCDDITQNHGLVFFLLSEAQWRGLPGNTTQDAAGNDVYDVGYDVSDMMC